MSAHSKIIFRYGTMNSGKSLQLLATAYNFQEREIPFLILKSKMDDRNGSDVVYSRALGSRECVSVSTEDNLYTIITTFLEHSHKLFGNGNTLKWILVDEAQFLTPEQVDQLAAIADNFEINIICYGLRTDFQSKLFPGSKRLFEICDSIEEIKTTCYCGSKTQINARIDEDGNIITDGNQIEIGGNEKYVSLCRKCYFERIGNKYYNNKDFN